VATIVTKTATGSPQVAPKAAVVTPHTVAKPARPSRLTASTFPATIAAGGASAASSLSSTPDCRSRARLWAANEMVKNRNRIDIDTPK
jgi:hypothetical protein